MAGGREMHLRSLQPLALHVVNSLFLGDYLTSEGQAAEADLAMIADAGFTVLGAGPDPSRDRHAGPADVQGSGAEQGTGERTTTPCGSACGSAAGSSSGDGSAPDGGRAPADVSRSGPAEAVGSAPEDGSRNAGDPARTRSAAASSAPTGAGMSPALAALLGSGDGPEQDEDDTRVRVELSPTVRRRGAGTSVAPNA